MADFEPLTRGGFPYEIHRKVDGRLYGLVRTPEPPFEQSWDARTGAADQITPIENDPRDLMRTSVDRVTAELYWIELPDGRRKVTLQRPTVGSTTVIVASRSVNLREGVVEV